MAAAFWMQFMFVLWYYNCNFSIFSWFVSPEGKCFSAKWHFSGGWLCEETRNQKFLGQEAVFGANGNIQFRGDDFFCMHWYLPSTSFEWPPDGTFFFVWVINVVRYNWSDNIVRTKLCYFFNPLKKFLKLFWYYLNKLHNLLKKFIWLKLCINGLSSCNIINWSKIISNMFGAKSYP